MVGVADPVGEAEPLGVAKTLAGADLLGVAVRLLEGSALLLALGGALS